MTDYFSSLYAAERDARGYEWPAIAEVSGTPAQRFVELAIHLFVPMLDVIAHVLEAFEEEVEWRERNPQLVAFGKNIQIPIPFDVVATFKQAVEKELEFACMEPRCHLRRGHAGCPCRAFNANDFNGRE